LSTNIAAGGIIDEMELSPSMIPAAAVLVDSTRSCKYSYMLLMMGEGIPETYTAD
jgi:hypothetical protein